MTQTIDPKELQIFQGTQEWSALYHKGKLVHAGDHYIIEEKVYSMLGIEVEQTDDFVLDDGHTVLKTVEEVRQAAEMREGRERMAADFRRQAAELVARANDLERR